MSEIGERGWITLSHNKEVRYNPEERDMAMRTGVPLFMLIGKRGHHVLAKNLVQTLPRITAFLEAHEAPFIAKVYAPGDENLSLGRPGRVEMWLTHETWLEKHGP